MRREPIPESVRMYSATIILPSVAALYRFVAIFFDKISLMEKPRKRWGGGPERGGPREYIFRVRLSDTERDLFNEVAGFLGLESSSWARAVLLAEARRVAKDRARGREAGSES